MVNKRVHAYAEVATVIVVWGIASVVIKGTLDGIAPVPFLTYRFFLSTLFALPFLSQIPKLFHKKTLALSVILYALLSAPVGLGILFLGLNKTSVINLSLVQAVEPLLLAYIAHKLFNDHLSKRGKIGVLLALFGAILTLVQPLLAIKDIGTIEGNILLFAYIAADLTSILILKKLMKQKISPSALTNLSFIVAFFVFLTINLAIDTPKNILQSIKVLPLKYHFGVWYMALFSGTIAFALRAKAQKTLTVTEVSIFGYLSPIISTVLAILFLNERVTPLFTLGAVFIAFGVFLVEYKKKSSV